MIIGQTLGGHYRITDLLGGGGFGETALAEDLHLPNHPLCVVKQLKPQCTDPDQLKTARRLFDTEVKILYKLGNHDQIPKLFAHFEENREFYLVQELIEGHDLTHEIKAGKSLSETLVIQLLQDILEVLEFVHKQEVIHRDIKPANLMRRDSDKKIVLIDFGAVKQVSTQMTNLPGQISKTIGIISRGYTPSEQANGEPRLCSDLYALGMIGIEALTGVSPAQLSINPNTQEVIWKNRVSINPKFATILEKMVRYNFKQRYQSTTEVLQDLKSLGASPKSNKLWLILIGLAVASTVFFFSFQLFNKPQPQTTPTPAPTDPIVW